MRRNSPNRRRRGIPRFKATWLGALAFVVLAFLASAEKTSTTKVKDFSVPEYFPQPHETQMKSLLQGAEAEPETGGLILITDVKLKTFGEAGEPQMLVEAPHCVFDSVQRAVSSSGPFSVQSVDGKFHLEGEGFLWQETNSSLIISNRVRTTIRNFPSNSLKP